MTWTLVILPLNSLISSSLMPLLEKALLVSSFLPSVEVIIKNTPSKYPHFSLLLNLQGNPKTKRSSKGLGPAQARSNDPCGAQP